MKTGFEELDKVIDLEKSGLIVLGARPAMGKSTFALNIATNVAVKTGTSVAIFSLEMSKEAIVNRILCSQAMVDSRKVRTGKIDSEEWLKISEGLSSLLEAGIYLDDTPGITINELTAKSRKLKLEKNIGLIVIDYLQLMGFADKSQCLSRIQEVSEIFRRLKILSQELNVPIIIVSQLSRAPEKRENHRPVFSDLHESGAIVQDADVIMFLYKEDFYNPETEDKNIAEIIIAQNRYGELGTVKLKWLGKYLKFENLEE